MLTFSLKNWVQTIFIILIFTFSTFIGTAADLSLHVHALAEQAFQQEHEKDIIQAFKKGIPSLKTAEEQCQAWRILAQYEEHKRLYTEAAAHYQKAAAFCNAEANRLSLCAVRAFLCGGELEAARTLLTRIASYQSNNEYNPDYTLSAVYEVWLLLAENQSDKALPLIHAYCKKKNFLAHHSALLFTLWWVDNDEQARERLITEFSETIEAAAVRGEVVIQPSAFWYLMPRTKKIFSDSVLLSVQPVQQAKPLYYQIGFYKTKQYADALMNDLRSKKFIPRIKEETRPSGTVYYLVFVEENETNDIGNKLKNAGYEAFPVFP